MNKRDAKKRLPMKSETLRFLSSKETSRVAGGTTIIAPGCSPNSCATCNSRHQISSG